MSNFIFIYNIKPLGVVAPGDFVVNCTTINWLSRIYYTQNVFSIIYALNHFSSPFNRNWLIK